MGFPTKGLLILAAGFLLGGCAQFWEDLGAAAVWNWDKEVQGVERGQDVRTLAAGQLSFRKQVKNLMELKWQHVVRQELDYSCGSAALATLLQYYHGMPVTEEEIIRQVVEAGDIRKIKRRGGFSLLDLKKFAKKHGFSGEGYRMDFEALVQLQKPVIVPVVWRGYDHFVVFRGIDGGRVYLADPAYGNVTVKVDSFMAMWNKRIAFVVTNGKEPPSEHKLAINGKDGLYVDAHSVNRVAPNTGIHTILRAEF